MKTNDKAVIIFDGNCKLCNGSVRFISQRDYKKKFHYISLQSEKAKQMLDSSGIDFETTDSVLLVLNEKILVYSTAVLTIARYLSGLWPLIYCLIIIPKIIRDPIYKLIAKRRHKWFDKMKI